MCAVGVTFASFRYTDTTIFIFLIATVAAIFTMEAFMKRRDFLERTAIAVSASLVGSVWPDGYRLVGSAFAAGNGDDQKESLEHKFAEFALAIRYEALPADVVASA